MLQAQPGVLERAASKEQLFCECLNRPGFPWIPPKVTAPYAGAGTGPQEGHSRRGRGHRTPPGTPPWPAGMEPPQLPGGPAQPCTPEHTGHLREQAELSALEPLPLTEPAQSCPFQSQTGEHPVPSCTSAHPQLCHQHYFPKKLKSG